MTSKPGGNATSAPGRRSLWRAVCTGTVACLLTPGLMAQATATSAGMDEDGGPHIAGLVGMVDPATQEMVPPPQAQQSAPATPTSVVAVSGVVMNAATGSPVPRALVQLDNGELGTMTDGDGRFTIEGVPTGTQSFSVKKPGFRGRLALGEFVMPSSHTVHVREGMPALQFDLAPENVVYGKVALSTGDPGVGIGVQLMRRTIQNGHAVWSSVERHQTTPDGNFRFSGLEDGTYLLETEAEFGNDNAEPPPCDKMPSVELPGYAVTFYGDAGEASGAAKIAVAGGEQAQANLTLNRTTFRAVRVTQAHDPGPEAQVEFALMDREGTRLEYPLRIEEKSHLLCGYLPDGSYTLAMTASSEVEIDLHAPDQPLSRMKHPPKIQAGTLDVNIEGAPATGLRMVLGPWTGTPVRFRYEPGPPKKPVHTPGTDSPEGDEPDPEPLTVSAAQVDELMNRGQDQQHAALWMDTDTYQLETVAPGNYWIDVTANRQGVCVGAVTAGGQGLGQMPWSAGPAGTGSSIDVVLRTDCASLTLSAESLVEMAGEQRSYYYYVVPEFDSATDIRQGVVREDEADGESLTDMTPGTYRVLTFDRPQVIEFRSAQAMERYAGMGKEITLEPNGKATIQVEAAQP